jgi:hypothetical protein
VSLAAFTWTTRARPFVQLGIGDSRSFRGAVWDVARWDVDPARWSGLEPQWLDITCDTRSATCSYGRAATTDRFVPGSATVVVDNATGWADPNANDAPGVLTVRPGRPIRFGVEHAVHGSRVLFRGFVDAMNPVYSPVDTDTVELLCLDALGEINRAKLRPVAAPVGDGEAASARAHRILDAVGWLPRDVQPSSETLLATDLGGQVADLLGRTADSAGGAVFGDLDGRVAFRPRDWQTYTPDTPIDGTIGNVDPSDVCPVEWERPFARADITTRAIIGRDLATAIVVDDPDGIARYGVEPFERTDLLTLRDSSLQMLAERVMRTRGEDTAPRVRSVSLNARTSDAALDLMSTVEVYRPSRYRCRLQYPRGLVFDDEYFATGVAHDLTPRAWSLMLNLDVAAPFEASGGRWDGAYWDHALWTNAVRLRSEALALLEEITT